jgi:hypothetical protein
MKKLLAKFGDICPQLFEAAVSLTLYVGLPVYLAVRYWTQVGPVLISLVGMAMLILFAMVMTRHPFTAAVFYLLLGAALVEVPCLLASAKLRNLQVSIETRR